MSSARRNVHTLRTAVSFCAKGSFASLNKKLGEDAVLHKTWITPGSYQGASFVGVADGVGGWKRHGVDPSYLSTGLLHEMSALFKQNEKLGNTRGLTESAKLPACQSLLTEAFSKLFNIGSKYAGGTTVCTGIFNPQLAEIEVLNLGDSGAWLVRENEILEKTLPLVHGMTPQQLTIVPPSMSPADFAVDLDPQAQTSHSSLLRWQLKPGDMLLFATDGYFDNVSQQDTLAVFQKAGQISSTSSLKTLANKLLELAYYNSINSNLASPFALRCLQEDEFDYWGGKPDDISLALCFVSESELDFPV